MQIEKLVSDMMTMSVKARLWHWRTDTAQHHTTYEDFLNQNENLTDSLVESALGNEVSIDFSGVGVQKGQETEYSIENARENLRSYRDEVFEAKKSLESTDAKSSEELITILDDVTELASKTLYLLKLK